MLQNLVIGTSSALIFRSRNRKVKSDFSWLVRELFSASRGLRIEFQGFRIQDPGSRVQWPTWFFVSLIKLGFRVADISGSSQTQSVVTYLFLMTLVPTLCSTYLVPDFQAPPILKADPPHHPPGNPGWPLCLPHSQQRALRRAAIQDMATQDMARNKHDRRTLRRVIIVTRT